MKNFFVIDVGNTSTKWGIANHQRLIRQYDFPTEKFKHAHKKIPLLNLPRYLGGAIVSCVVPQALPGIKKSLQKLGIKKIHIVSSKMDLGIGIRYPMPEKIGADRLVNAVAAATLYGAPVIVVDFGTAVTFDVVSSKKEYLGGVIAPGVSAMTDYLHEKTALLPRITIKEPKSSIGKNTKSAMQIGVVIGYRGLIIELLKAISCQMKLELSGSSKPLSRRIIQVVATGGHSSLIASKIPCIQYIDQNLTLNGLRLLYNRLIAIRDEK